MAGALVAVPDLAGVELNARAVARSSGDHDIHGAGLRPAGHYHPDVVAARRAQDKPRAVRGLIENPGEAGVPP